MSTSTRLIYQIGLQTEIEKLKTLRDTGLAMILTDTFVTDFIQADADEMVIKINERIVELGGVI